MMAVLNHVSWMFTKCMSKYRGASSVLSVKTYNLDGSRGSVVTAVTSVRWYCWGNVLHPNFGRRVLRGYVTDFRAKMAVKGR